MKKIAVIASASGSGKTTVGRALAALLDVPFVELDALVHGPNWVDVTGEELRARLQPVLGREGWVIDGSYFQLIDDLVVREADAIVWIDLPIRVWFLRLLRRTIGRIVLREEIWNGNRESLASAVWGRESLFAWSFRSHLARRRDWPARLDGRPVIRLRSTRDVERFLSSDLSSP